MGKKNQYNVTKEQQGKWYFHPFETLLIGVKGYPDEMSAPFKFNSLSTLVEELQPAKHSQKPDIFYHRIKQHYNAPFFLELFARGPQCYVDGLTAVRNEIAPEMCDPLPENPEGYTPTEDFLRCLRANKYITSDFDEAEREAMLDAMDTPV